MMLKMLSDLFVIALLCVVAWFVLSVGLALVVRLGDFFLGAMGF